MEQRMAEDAIAAAKMTLFWNLDRIPENDIPLGDAFVLPYAALQDCWKIVHLQFQKCWMAEKVQNSAQYLC